MDDQTQHVVHAYDVDGTYRAIPVRQLRMRSAAEIEAMRNQIEQNIHANGWSPQLDGMSQVLSWVLDDTSTNSQVQSYLDTPVNERRTAWIAAGGNPADWTGDDDA